MRLLQDMQKALEEKDELLTSSKDALKQAQRKIPVNTEQTELRNLRAELQLAKVVAESEKKRTAEAIAKKVEAELRESSACKHQSSLAKSLAEAQAKLEEAHKQSDQEANKRIDAEQRAIQAEVMVCLFFHYTHAKNDTSQARQRSHLPAKPQVGNTDDKRQIVNLRDTVQRCNNQISELRVSGIRAAGQLNTARSLTGKPNQVARDTMIDKMNQLRADNVGLRESKNAFIDAVSSLPPLGVKQADEELATNGQKGAVRSQSDPPKTGRFGESRALGLKA